VKTSGNKKGESLVMIHGWGMNSGAWEAIRSNLEADYAMHWIDLPGYGVNNNILAKNIDEIIDLVLPHIPKGSHLIGWSLGGLVAQAIAEKLSKSTLTILKTITLVASSPKFSQTADWKHAISHEILDNFSKNLQEDSEGTLKRFVALQFMGIKGTKQLQKALFYEII
jgi:pimeloyl-[acyl-carrier protein] methyl ester esterase